MLYEVITASGQDTAAYMDDNAGDGETFADVKDEQEDDREDGQVEKSEE